MNVEDGRALRRREVRTADVVVVGSGPAGAAVARTLARAGADVVVLEEGGHHRPADFPPDTFRAMASMYRDLGGTLALGPAPMPVVQGRAVGGTSVVNGAISWRLPRDVHQGWLDADPALEEGLPWVELDALFDALESELSIGPTDDAIAGPKNELMARGAEALGLEHRPISRNTKGCEGLGRCLQGCPAGHKQSMDLTLLPDAASHGARIVSGVRIDRVVHARGRAIGVAGRTAGGGRLEVQARHAVVLAASAVGSPAILLRSGLGGGDIGEGFQCHPGVSVTGVFPDPVRLWRGATQGHEVIGLRREGLKFEVLGYDLGLAATRLRGVGRALAAGLDELDHHAHWGAAIKATARGRVIATPTGAVVRYALTDEDLRRMRRGVRVLGELFLAAGATRVEPGVKGWDPVVTDARRMAAFEQEGPLRAPRYSFAATHLFGTVRMGSDPAAGVRPDFRHRDVEGLYVADSSVFPTATGVNPQTSILAVATLCGREVIRRVGGPPRRPGLRARLRRWLP